MEGSKRPAQVSRSGSVEVATAIECNLLEYNGDSTIDIKHKYSAEAQRINAKPDVVMALRSAEEKNSIEGSEEIAAACIMKEGEEFRICELTAVVDSRECEGDETTRWSRPILIDAKSSSPESKVGGCTSIETEDGRHDTEGVLS